MQCAQNPSEKHSTSFFMSDLCLIFSSTLLYVLLYEVLSATLELSGVFTETAPAKKIITQC